MSDDILVSFKCSNCKKECNGYPEEDEDGNFWCTRCMIEKPEPTPDTMGTSRLICPWCGVTQFREHFELHDEDDDYVCDTCEKEFEYERETIAIYYSKKKE